MVLVLIVVKFWIIVVSVGLFWVVVGKLLNLISVIEVLLLEVSF